PEYRHELATTCTNQAILRGQGPRDLLRAEAAVREAIGLLRQLADDFPALPDYRLALAKGLHNLGLLLKQGGRPGPAEDAYRQALALREARVREGPDVPAYRHDLALSHANLSYLLRTDRPAAARAALGKAIAHWEKVALDLPAVAS